MALESGFLSEIAEVKYSLYVLFLMMVCYMINQLDVFSLIATNLSTSNEFQYGEKECRTANQTTLDILLKNGLINGTCADNIDICSNSDASDQQSPCSWYYLGLGWQYQLLAGPIYIVIFSISGIPIGLLSELRHINRQKILAACCLLWGAMTICGGFADQYWHLAVTRLLLGIFSAGCVPFCASIISDYFPKRHGASLGFFNWGVYVGYSFTFLLIIAERELGWRSVYFIAGSPAIAIAALIWITIKEPERQQTTPDDDPESENSVRKTLYALKDGCKYFTNPVLLILCIGGAIRNGAGFVWAYNIVQFFDVYHPGTRVEEWMSWIPLTFGSIGAFGGGYLSDRLSRNKGLSGRLTVLILCCLASAPFQVGTLFLPMPWAFISHMPAYLIGEMWIGVCVAIVVDMVPGKITTSAVAVYFFIIQIIGGNMNIFVTPITENLDYRFALLICFPGFYVLAALFFILSFAIHKHQVGKANELLQNESSNNALKKGNKDPDVAYQEIIPDDMPSTPDLKTSDLDIKKLALEEPYYIDNDFTKL